MKNTSYKDPIFSFPRSIRHLVLGSFAPVNTTGRDNKKCWDHIWPSFKIEGTKKLIF